MAGAALVPNETGPSARARWVVHPRGGVPSRGPRYRVSIMQFVTSGGGNSQCSLLVPGVVMGLPLPDEQKLWVNFGISAAGILGKILTNFSSAK